MGFWDIFITMLEARLKAYREEKAKEEAEKKKEELAHPEPTPEPEQVKQPEPEPSPEPTPTPDDPLPDDIPVEEITFVGGPNVGQWKKTYPVEVRFSGNDIQLLQEGTKVWPEVKYGDGKVCANPWVIAKINGRWIGASFEWMRKGSQERAKRAVHGDHIKRNEFGNDWSPKTGELLGFCVAGLSRGGESNVEERTPIKTLTW